MQKVYVIAKNGQPLMPTGQARARKLLKGGKAIIITVAPFTIQLTYESKMYVQKVTLGIDSGYNYMGFSAITEKEELISGELTLLSNHSIRLLERAMYRRIRRYHLRYRAPRFDHRRRDNGWLAPSIQHKYDSHLRLIEKLKKILPISDIIVEVANFDIQKIKNPNVNSEMYQQGEQFGFENVREYVLHRDNHTCQNPNCKNKSKTPVLVTHHIRYRSKGGTDKPSDFITLCNQCHTPENHHGVLKDWRPMLKAFKGETFMSTIRYS